MSGLKVLIADDHPLFRAALRGIVGTIALDATIHEAEDYASAAAVMDQQVFDLILVDLMMPGVNGMSGLIDLIARNNGRPIIVVTGQGDPETVRSVHLCGASGLIDKRWAPDKMAGNIRIVLNGGRCFHEHSETGADLAASMGHPLGQPLTDKQAEVLNLLVSGKANKEIAKLLEISPNTVKAHISEILRKFGVSSRLEAVAFARQSDMPQPQQ